MVIWLTAKCAVGRGAGKTLGIESDSLLFDTMEESFAAVRKSAMVVRVDDSVDELKLNNKPKKLGQNNETWNAKQ